MSAHLEGVERCPQCGIARPLLIYKASIVGKMLAPELAYVSVIYQCTACEDIVCATGMTGPKGFDQQALLILKGRNIQAHRIIPALDALDSDLPARPKNYLQQAVESKMAPDGAIMLAASAVDAMLKIKGFDDGSLYSRIEEAAHAGIITESMKDWAHAVRLESNKPRHADINEPHATVSDAEQSIEFAKALGDFLFVFPERIARGRAASEKFGSN